MSPYSEGYRAYPGGWNPFIPGSSERQAWEDGFQDAHQDSLDGGGSFYGIA